MEQIYVSSANQKYKEYLLWVDKHPIKHFETIFNMKLNLWQKIKLLYFHFQSKREKRKFDKLLSRYIR